MDLESNKNYYWYVQATDSFGGATKSDIWGFTTGEGSNGD